jgi:hypothetical protein
MKTISMTIKYVHIIHINNAWIIKTGIDLPIVKYSNEAGRNFRRR